MPGISSRKTPAATCAIRKAQLSRPKASSRITVQQSLIIGAEFKTVISVDPRKIIGKGWLDIVVACLAPSIEPIDQCVRRRRTAQASDLRDRTKVIVFRKELRSCVVKP